MKFTEVYSYGYVLSETKHGVAVFTPEGKVHVDGSLFLEGSGRLSFTAVRNLLKQGKSVVVKVGGRRFITFFMEDGHVYRLVLKQLETINTPSRRIHIAYKILEAATLNKAWLLRILGLKQESRKIIEMLPYFRDYDKTLDLMGLEAVVTREYYEALRAKIPEPYLFETRTRRPPRDHFSAILNLMNMWLYDICLEEIVKHGLDPRVGFLHTPFRDRVSLALDLAEEFKQPVVDIVAVALLASRGLSIQRDFRYSGDAIYLSKSGMKKVWRAFNQRLELRKNGLKLRALIGRQVKNLVDFIEGRCMEYEPFIIE